MTLLLMAVSWPTGRWAGPLPVSQAQTHEELLKEFEPYVDYLNEFTERRRLKVYFANEQSVFYGAPVGYVNVGRGNLTFVRRDMVTVGRIPLVLARVYDSSFDGGDDFGRGWHLSVAETIKLEADGVVLLSESAAPERFVPSGGGLVQAQPCPTDILELRPVDPQRFQITLRIGFVKEYTLLGELFRLTRVQDRNGNAVTLEYQHGKLVRLRSENNRQISLSRDAAGRIVSVRDDQDRRVSYRYNERGQLVEVTDLGGNGWRYEYNERGQLSRAIDPLRHVNLAVVYDEPGRVTELQSPGGDYRYRYEMLAQRTVVSDGHGFESVYVQNDAGLTTAITNPLEVETRVVLDESNHVQKLYRNGALQAEMSYDPGGRPRSLVTYDGEGPTPMSYVYDEQGRLVEIRSAEDQMVLSYDERGNLLERRNRDGSARYSYSPQGDLLTMNLTDGTALSFEVDADGQITSVMDAQNRRTSFRYYPDGKLSQTRFADGSAHIYHYTRLGTRRLIEFDDGAAIEYTYNAAGSLMEIQIRNRDGTVKGQLLTLDEAQKVRVIERLAGGETHLTYDRMGNVTTATTGDQTMRFTYDRLNRLTDVVSPDGKRLRYSYRDGEPDLRLQMDHHSGRALSERMTSGLTFSTGLELIKNRTESNSFGGVRFDRAMVDYRLISEFGLVLPDAVPVSAIARMRVMELGESRYEDKKSFAAPSNVMFIPAEYWAVNCCPECDYDPINCQCFTDPLGGGGGCGSGCEVFTDNQGNRCYRQYCTGPQRVGGGCPPSDKQGCPCTTSNRPPNCTVTNCTVNCESDGSASWSYQCQEGYVVTGVSSPVQGCVQCCAQ
jgi:YD repeat-containing protein